MPLFTPEPPLPRKSQWDFDFGAKHTFRHRIHSKLTKGSHANYEKLLAEEVKVFSDSSPEEWTYLSKMHCTSKLSTSHTSMFSSWKNKQMRSRNQQFNDRFQTEFMFRVYDLTFEMNGMCILVYGFMSLISTWVLMFLRSSATTDTWSHDRLDKTAFLLRSPLTLYVLSNEGVVHYVTVISFQYFLKFSNVIVLVSTGREKNRQHCVAMWRVTRWLMLKRSHSDIWGTLQTI